MNNHNGDWRRQYRLPNTIYGTLHNGINFVCARCEHRVIQDLDELYNEYRQCSFYGVHCSNPNCFHSIGAFYLDPFWDSDTMDIVREFPCAKITYLRRTRTNEIYNETLLEGNLSDVEIAVGNLVKHRYNRDGVRIRSDEVIVPS
eukprot:gene16870-23124_t